MTSFRWASLRYHQYFHWHHIQSDSRAKSEEYNKKSRQLDSELQSFKMQKQNTREQMVRRVHPVLCNITLLTCPFVVRCSEKDHRHRTETRREWNAEQRITYAHGRYGGKENTARESQEWHEIIKLRGNICGETYQRSSHGRPARQAQHGDPYFGLTSRCQGSVGPKESRVEDQKSRCQKYVCLAFPTSFLMPHILDAAWRPSTTSSIS